MLTKLYNYLATAGLLGSTLSTVSTVIVPPTAQNRSATAVFKSSPHLALDAPKLDLVNATAFDWWYFDAIAADGSAQVGITLFNTDTTTLGFPISIGTTNFVLCTAYFPNGTIYEQMIPADVATIVTAGDGASGAWAGTGVSFVGSPNLKTYVVTVDAPQLALKGTIKLRSNAPARFACAPNKPGRSEYLVEDIGWANAMPDAHASVDFTFGDDKLKFSGYGYHDKNWGINTLPNVVGSWYWGHARIGPYSLVFFDTLDKDNTETVSGYLVKDGVVKSLQCEGLIVRPVGSDFPPTVDSPLPTALHLEYTTSEGVFVADFSGPMIWEAALDHPGWGYYRWAGAISGGFKDGLTYSGASVWEWIHFLA